MRLAIATFFVGFALAACAFYLVLEFRDDEGPTAASTSLASEGPASLGTADDFATRYESDWQGLDGWDDSENRRGSGAGGRPFDAGPSPAAPGPTPPIPYGVGDPPPAAQRVDDRFVFNSPKSAWRSFVESVASGNLDRALAHVPEAGSLDAAVAASAAAVPTLLAQFRNRFVATYGEQAFEEFAAQVGGPGGDFPVQTEVDFDLAIEQTPLPLSDNSLRFVLNDREFVVTQTDDGGWIVQGDAIEPGQEQVAKMAYQMEAAFASALANTSAQIGEPGMGPTSLAGELQRQLSQNSQQIFQGLGGGDINNPDFGKDF
ncbi:MAG: hypothetical protein ACFBZ8_05405 [Opitutales bacterium]